MRKGFNRRHGRDGGIFEFRFLIFDWGRGSGTLMSGKYTKGLLSGALEQFAQLVFCSNQNPFLGRRDVCPAAVDIEIQHGHCRPKRRGFAPRAPLSGAFERFRNRLRIGLLENAGLQVHRVAVPRHFTRPPAIRGLLARVCFHFRLKN